MSEKPTIAVFGETVYIKLFSGELVALYGNEVNVSRKGEVTDYAKTAITSLTSDELWEAVREIILERAKDEGH